MISIDLDLFLDDLEEKMEKKSSGFLTFLGVIFAILLVVLLPISLLVFDISKVVFNPPVAKRIINQEVTQSNLIPAALEWYSEERAQERVEMGVARTGVDEPDIVRLISFLDAEDWKKGKEELLSDEILTGWVSETVDAVYTWIDSEDAVPQVFLSFRAFKERTGSEHGVNAVTIAYDELAPCTEEQIDDFEDRLAATPPGQEVLYNLCRFPGPWYEDQFSDYLESLEEVVGNIPDEFSLTEALGGRDEDNQGTGAEDIKAQLRLIRTLMNVAWLIPLVLVLLIVAVKVRSLPSLGRWLGIPALIGGLFTLLPPLVFPTVITNQLAAGPLSETPELIRTEATRSILTLADAFFQPMLLQAIVLMAIGVVLYILFLVTRKKETAPAETEAEE
jgi:hypothetical protein